MEFKQRSVPFRVTTGKVIVHSYYMYTLSGQRVQVSRQGTHQSFTLTSGHLGNFTAVQHHTTYQLYIVMYHVPKHLYTCSFPAVCPQCFIALYGHIFLARSIVPVKLCCRNFQALIFRETS
ncbi:hypothetical protein D3C86_1403570 [compost metagenome]